MKAIIFIAFAGGALSSIPASAQKKEAQPRLQYALDSLYTVEAKLYQQWTAARGDSARAAAERAREGTVERDQHRVQALMVRYGFPTYAMVGQATSRRFGELVLRYSRLPEFQQQVQQLMTKEVRKNNADDVTFATLTDVVELGAGRPQVYGTQLVYRGDNAGPVVREPLLDPAKVNARRASLGLEPLETYLKKRKDKHQPVTKQKLK